MTEARQIMQIIDDLAVSYGWAPTATERMALTAAIAGHDRVAVSTAAHEANRHAQSLGRPFTPADLVAAMQARNRQPITEAPPLSNRISEHHQEAGRAGIAASRAALAPKEPK